MASKLDDIFNECYERIRSGESIESCLRSYPQYRVQLEPLLRTTFDIGRRISYIHPRPEFKHWARVRLESAQRYPKQQTRAETPAASTWLRHGWAVAVSAGIVLLLTTGSTMAASSQALPDQPLYPVKLATEQVRVALAVSDAQKAEFETELAKIRAMELEAMANAGKTEEASKAAVRYDNQFEKAMDAIIKAEGTEPLAPVYIPPAVTTPPAVTAPPEVITPPVTTTPPEVITPPVTTTPPEVITPPVTTTPPEVITPPVTTTPPEVVTPPVTTTPPEVITPTENATPTQTVTPPTTATRDKGKSAKTENLIISLNKSTSKSVTALQGAKKKAAEPAKDDWQKALDNLKSWSGDKDTTSKSDNVTGNQGTTNTGGTGHTTIQSDNNTTPSPASPSPTKQPPSRWHR
jgi:hypothetical protein